MYDAFWGATKKKGLHNAGVLLVYVVLGGNDYYDIWTEVFLFVISQSILACVISSNTVVVLAQCCGLWKWNLRNQRKKYLKPFHTQRRTGLVHTTCTKCPKNELGSSWCNYQSVTFRRQAQLVQRKQPAVFSSRRNVFTNMAIRGPLTVAVGGASNMAALCGGMCFVVTIDRAKIVRKCHTHIASILPPPQKRSCSFFFCLSNKGEKVPT